jgi:hypothetical protein
MAEDHEAEVVDANSTVDVAESPEAHDENRGDKNVTHEHPEQVARVAGFEGVDLDSLEDRGQRDQNDGPVDGCHQDAERCIAQCDPLIPGVVFVERTGTNSFFCHEGPPQWFEGVFDERQILSCCVLTIQETQIA